MERVVWGAPAAARLAAEVERLGADRVFVVASGTLSRMTPLVSAVRDALGFRFAGLFDDCREHTPLESVLACATAVRGARADLIVTLGGGTPIDTVKIVQLCLSHAIDDLDALVALARRPTDRPSTVRQLIVPTTLSGGEYSSIAGGTNSRTRTKEGYRGPDLCGRVVILDPAATLFTPQWLWLSTAIRAIDHAVEGYCSPATNPLVQATALHALKLFPPALRRTHAAAEDLAARLAAQQATWLAAASLGRVTMGASHGIGYVLGSFCGVPHGYTSCVMLPAVLRWNQDWTSAAEGEIAAALGAPGGSAADALGALLTDLGLPRRLSEVGVERAAFAEIAERAAAHPVVRANPRPVRSAADVLEILDLAA